tara:strand:+ start:581 stop:979 length:399 start_codon:yes stop_codon:yes gene_type:complete
MTINNAKFHRSWSTEAQLDEVYTLYESNDMLERIIAHRYNLLKTEYILITPSLINACERCNPLGSNILFPEEYPKIAVFRRKIECYQLEKDKLEQFTDFFGITIWQFFNAIALKTPVNQVSWLCSVEANYRY